ncbi:2-hydroxyacid dehydrogenase [Aestuariibius sp. HNIBRBA575]|uniref:2-hydroxyacid dehydrogenase n=1 Tax=Aestuariibius sp. HNIBRBA575 TaxID=3233343 RepID=UPI0034A47B27
MIQILNATAVHNRDAYGAALKTALSARDLTANISSDIPGDQVDYIIYAPNGTITDFTPFTNCKAVLSTWAGVDKITSNQTLTQPLTRMVDDGLKFGMVEWVSAHVLRYHLGIDAQIVNPDHIWDQTTPPLACERAVTILGLGELGQACGQMLAQLGFNVTGWSRSQKNIDNITCLFGPDGLKQALATAEILVLLLPNTPQTDGLINADRLAQLPRGAFLLNPGRGPLIDDAALIEALDRGHLAHATLDVFRIEPLPQDDPFWSHPKVTVTAHVASETRVNTAVEVLADNIKRSEAGQSLNFLVDRDLGY